MVKVYVPDDLRLNMISEPSVTVLLATVKISLTVGTGAGTSTFLHDASDNVSMMSSLFIS
jgi:hypothetical protein